ncbi:hypothetical protein N2152v2_004088 [Parachlorella kessleri]
MATASYLHDVRQQLTVALCLHNFPSQLVERHNKPEIEVQTSPELLLPPVRISRSDNERCLIEQSINSTRISFKFKATDQVEEYLLRTYLSFMIHRAEELELVRRAPLPGYDLTLLITSSHLLRYERPKLIDFICQFVEDLSSEISEMKLSLRTRARAVAEEFWRVAEQQQQQQQQR